MIKNKKSIIIISLIVVLLFAGCRPPTSSGGSSSSSTYKSGSGGLSMNFVSGLPPSKIYADHPYNNIQVPISIEIKNNGAFPTPEDEREGSMHLWKTNKHDDVIIISGFDSSIITGWEIGGEDAETTYNNYPYILLEDKTEILEGKSANNPEGGYDLIELTGYADLRDVNIEKYSPTFQVTACYDYMTKAETTVCIDPRPYSSTSEKKVCEIEDKTLSTQGAPISVTKVEETALSNSIQLKIHFKNSGNGDVIATDLLDKCSNLKGETDRLRKGDMDLVKIIDVRLGGKSIKEDCGPFLKAGTNENYARLINNKGFFTCNYKIDKDAAESAYEKPLYVELAYGYRNTISKKMDLIRVPRAR